MKIRHYSLIAWLSIYVLPVAAQAPPLPASLSLDKAIEIALSNNPEISQRAYDYEIADQKVEEARFRQLPAVSADIDLRYNLIIPSTPVPANAFNPNAPADEVNALRFGTNWAANAGVDVSYPLLDKSIRGQIREREEEAQLAAIQRQISETELAAEVRLAYAECLLARTQVEIAVEDTLNSRVNLQMVEDRYRNGRALITELNQARIGVNNAQSRLAESRLVRTRAERKLLYYLGYPEGTDEVMLEEDLEMLYDRFRSGVDSALQFDQSLTVGRLRQEFNLAELRLANARLDDLPTVSLQGFLGASFFDNRLRIFNADQWFGSSFLAIRLNIPITSRIANKTRIAQLEYQLLSSREAIRAGREQKTFEFAKALDNLAFYESEIKVKRQNMALSEANYLAIRQQYREGRATNDNLSSADFQFKQARAAYLQTFYDYVRAAITLHRIRKS